MKWFLSFVLVGSVLIGCSQNPIEFDSELNNENPAVVGSGFLEAGENSGVTNVHALIIYAQDSDDDYPLPDAALRQKIYTRISEYFRVMSYHQHRLHFQEVLQNGDFFRTERAAVDYKNVFAAGKLNSVYDGPFALFNEEILNQVQQENGAEIFDDIDLIMVITTDGGPGWYMPSVNAQGYARLGFDFSVNERTFGAKYGGITIEIGSDYLNSLYTEPELYWIFAHEYGHWLGYRRHRSKNNGIYSLMTEQLFTNENIYNHDLGPNPLDPLLLQQFGWLDFADSTRVQRVTPGQKEVVVRLNPIRSTKGIVLAQIALPGTASKSDSTYYSENFYVAYHKKGLNRFDDIYTGEGLLVWHSVLNSYLDVECSQGLNGQPNRDHLDFGENMGGLATDFFTPNNTVFTSTSNPNSNIWGLSDAKMANKPTGICIADLQEVDGVMAFRVVFE